MPPQPAVPVPIPPTPQPAIPVPIPVPQQQPAIPQPANVGGVIPALISALRANTTAVIDNTRAIKQGARGGIPPQARANAKDPLSITPLAAPVATVAGITGMVNAISPGAISTLTGSFQMLAGEIGKNFVPYVYAAADRLQDLTRWVQGLDPAFKTGLTRIIAFSTIGLAGLAVGSRVVAGAIGLATGAVRLFGGALTFLAANPIVLTLGAITAGVITLTGQWENLGKTIMNVLGYVSGEAYKGVKALGEAKVPGLDGTGQPKQKQQLPSDVLAKIPDLRQKILSVVDQPEKAKETIVELIKQEEKKLADAQAEQLADLGRRDKLQAVIAKSYEDVYFPAFRRQVIAGAAGDPTAAAAQDRAVTTAVADAKAAGLTVKESDVRRMFEVSALEQYKDGVAKSPFRTGQLLPTSSERETVERVSELQRRIGTLNELKTIGFGTGVDKPAAPPSPDAPIRDEVRSILKTLPETTRTDVERDSLPARRADVVSRIAARTQAQADAERKTAASLRTPLPFEGDDKRLATLYAVVAERRAELEKIVKIELAEYQKVKPGAESIPEGTDQYGRVRLAVRDQEEKFNADPRVKTLQPLTAIESRQVTTSLTPRTGGEGGKDVIFPKLFDSFAPPKPKFDPAKLKEAEAADARAESLDATVASLAKLERALRSLKPTADELIDSLPTDVQRRVRGADEKTWQDTIKQLVSQTEKEATAERAKLPAAQRVDADAIRGTNVVTRVVEALQEVFDAELQPGQREIVRGTPQFDRVMAAQQNAVQDAMRLATAEGVTIPPRAMQSLEPSSRDQLLPFKPPAEPESRVDEIRKRIAMLDAQKSVLKTIPNPATGETTQDGEKYLRNFVSPINARFTDAVSFEEAIQTQAFNVGDLEAQTQLQILEQQLKEQEDANGLLKDLNKNIEALRSAVGRLRFWEGP